MILIWHQKAFDVPHVMIYNVICYTQRLTQTNHVTCSVWFTCKLYYYLAFVQNENRSSRKIFQMTRAYSITMCIS